MINETKVRRYCAEDISLIENYDLAITDQDRTWECHHRLEVGQNGETISYSDLRKHGLYYNRPASELIFLTKSEHNKLHKIGNKNFLGKHHSEETRMKVSESLKGRTFSDEHRMKLSEARTGKTKSEETRKKIRESVKAYWEKKKAGI